MGVSPYCPNGQPHHWLIQGQSGECKRCGATRDDFIDPRSPSISALASKSVSRKPTHYRKREDYNRLRPRILAVYAETQSVTRTSRAFSPPIPPTTLRNLLTGWRLGPSLEVDETGELVFSLEPNTSRLRIRGEPSLIVRLTTGLQQGELEILAEGQKVVQSEYTVTVTRQGEG